MIKLPKSACLVALPAVILAAAAGLLAAAPTATASPAGAPSVRAAPAAAEHLLGSLACVTAKNCVAVGQSTSTSDYAQHPLLETWNGVRWTAVSVKLLAGQSGALGSVSCMSAQECLVAGSASNGPLLIGSGKDWAARRFPSGLHGLGSMSCTTAYCVDLGLANGYVAATWNGSRWGEAEMAAYNGSGNLWLEGLSCVKSRGCVAVGTVYGEYPVAETWNGSRWSLARLPQPRGTAQGNLLGVSCVSLTRCFAVGNIASVNFVDVLNGTKWTSVTLTRNSYQGLSSISCVSVRSCLAVGSSGQGLGLDSGKAFAISWNGKAWKPLPVPVPPHGGGKGNGSGFTSVTCVAATSCVAIGTAGSTAGTTGYSFSGTWNGRAWKLTAAA